MPNDCSVPAFHTTTAQETVTNLPVTELTTMTKEEFLLLTQQTLSLKKEKSQDVTQYSEESFPNNSCNTEAGSDKTSGVRSAVSIKYDPNFQVQGRALSLFVLRTRPRADL